jgi:SAM-dependent methyltransferase
MKKTSRPHVREGYDLWADTYDNAANPLVSPDRRHTMELLDPLPGQRILDAACGTGHYLKAIAGAGSFPVGLDVSGGMLNVARRQVPNLPLVQADLDRRFPFCSGLFDVVLSALVSEHLTNLPGFFEEVARVLVPEGRLIFSAFHPDLAAAGIEANFELDGVEYRLGAEKHTIEDFVDALSNSGLQTKIVREFAGDEELVRQIGRAKKYLGRPMLVLIEGVASAQ